MEFSTKGDERVQHLLPPETKPDRADHPVQTHRVESGFLQVDRAVATIGEKEKAIEKARVEEEAEAVDMEVAAANALAVQVVPAGSGPTKIGTVGGPKRESKPSTKDKEAEKPSR